MPRGIKSIVSPEKYAAVKKKQQWPYSFEAPLSFDVKILGERKLKLYSRAVGYRVLRHAAAKIRDALAAATPRGELAKGVSHAARRWRIIPKSDGSYVFANPASYTLALQYGSQQGKRPWPSVGPRTVHYSYRIYSSQAPGGIWKNAHVRTVFRDAVRTKLGEIFGKGSVT